MQVQTKTIAYSAGNITKCQCTNCPVQAHSACAMDKLQAASSAIERMRTDLSMQPPAPHDMPRVYCSTGTAACNDLDFSPDCICPTCQVWNENGLTNYKYCRDGSAERIG